jgi:hypothetical protein
MERQPDSSPAIPAPLRVISTVIAIFVPFIGPIASMILGRRARERSGSDRLVRIGVIMLGIHLILGVAVIASAPSFVRARRQAVIAEAKSGWFEILTCLTTYAIDHKRTLPTDIMDLVRQGYLVTLPVNPYTNEPMKHIELGERPQAGEFTYVPFFEDGVAKSCHLIGYGDECFIERGCYQEYGFKQVMLVLTSGDCVVASPPPFEEVFLRGSDTPVLLTNEHRPRPSYSQH